LHVETAFCSDAAISDERELLTTITTRYSRRCAQKASLIVNCYLLGYEALRRADVSVMDLATMIGGERERFMPIIATCRRRDATTEGFAEVLRRFHIPLIRFDARYA
jgi:hypothetical protein